MLVFELNNRQLNATELNRLSSRMNIVACMCIKCPDNIYNGPHMTHLDLMVALYRL